MHIDKILSRSSIILQYALCQFALPCRRLRLQLVQKTPHHIYYPRQLQSGQLYRSSPVKSIPPPRALHILTHPRQLELPVKRTGTEIRLGEVELAYLACLPVRDVTVFDFTMV